MLKRKLRLLDWIIFLALFWSFPLQAAYDSAKFNQDKPLKIIRITPKGFDVSEDRQITFQFNQPVVPVGKMKREASEIPITIQPAVDCQWRWLNTSALACQLTQANALKPATHYRITVEPGIETEQGKKLDETITYSFVTQRPKVSYKRLLKWTAPGMPKIRVTFNLPVTRQSVRDHLFFQYPGQPRIAVNVTSVAEAKAAEGEEVPFPSVSRYWVVSPRRLLPLDTEVVLRVEQGVETPKGPEKGIEKRTIVSFHTFPPFKFLGVHCYNIKDDRITFLPNKITEDFSKRCNPMERVQLRFSSPVLPSVVKENLLVLPDLAGGLKDYDPWENSYDYTRLDEFHRPNKEYSVSLPWPLKAYEVYTLKSTAWNFYDEFGRTLDKPINMRFATDHRAPDYNFEHHFSVLEKGVDSEVPFYMTNLDKLTMRYHRLTQEGWSGPHVFDHPLPKVQDVSVKIPFHIRKMVADDSGVVIGRFESEPSKKSYYTDYNWFFSQVTPFYIHVKLGHHNTLVWVTDYATGQPVADVSLSLYEDNLSAKKQLPDSIATAVTNEKGIAFFPGRKVLDPKMKINYAFDNSDKRLFIKADKGEDTALLPLDSEFEVHFFDLDVDFYPRNQPQYGHIRTWGTTAQGIYKVGDTVQYKILVRNQNNRQFVPAPRQSYSLKVIDPTGKTVHEEKDIRLNKFGSHANQFVIPKTAAVGWYRFHLSSDFSEENWVPMRVLISDFTPSPFRVRTVLNGKFFELGDEVKVHTSAHLHAGGPYVNAPMRVVAMVKERAFNPSHPATKNFHFDVDVDDYYDTTLFHTESKLDGVGEDTTTFTLADSPVLYGQLQVESAVKDDRGKSVANMTSARYVGRDRFVGLKKTQWVLPAGKPGDIQFIVADAHGEPVSNASVQVTIERRETKASRVKGAGNAYLTKFVHEWVAGGECQQLDDGFLISGMEAKSCQFIPEKAGSYRITAEITDTQGRPHSTELYQWVSGQSWVTWETGEDNSLDIEPEEEQYRVGETARYLVKNPYPNAQALVTVERAGILKQWVTTLENSMEIIEVPVEPDYAPGFFVSVVIMSPRVDKPIKNQVDLGKPAFRMGYAKTQVAEPYKRLDVAIESDKPVYHPGEEVTLDFHITPKHPFPDAEPKPPMELAVAVLDESVFDLLQAGKDYFDPYKGFYYLDDLDMENFSLLMRLVGRQKFEKKGANAGGDGGSGLDMRSVFKFVSYWNPSIIPDKAGKARVQFKVPDNLTGWRILAMAVTPGDRMGLSDANFKVNRPLEIRPVMPNQVTEGDSFEAGFSVMNRTEETQEVTVHIEASGVIALEEGQADPIANKNAVHKLKAKPYERYLVWLPLTTTDEGKIHFTATAKHSENEDGLTHTLPVRQRKALDTAASYGTTIAQKITESVQFPEDIHPDVGQLSVIASPSVINGVEGAFEYMHNYPYACWEQKLTKGVMASHYQNLKAYIDLDKFTWENNEALPQKTLDLASEYQAPNGGMTYYIPEERRVSPYLSAYTAMAFAWLKARGGEIPAGIEEKLHDYLLTLLRRDVLPDFYSKGMASTVRAVALAALAKAGKVEREDILRYHPHVPEMSLFGKAMYLLATIDIPRTRRQRNEVKDILLSHANQTAGKISFNETLHDGYKRLLSSQLRTQCAILSALVAYDENAGGETDASDLAYKLVRHITQSRKHQGHWENTQENMFCMNALIEYAQVYEKQIPSMQIDGWLEEEHLGKAQFESFTETPATFSHAIKATDVGRKTSVKLEKSGKGRLYYTIRMQYAQRADKAEATNAGIEVKREYHVERDGEWILLQNPMEINSGELVRVDLYISLPAARHFVVVDDPIPGGLEPVNRDLATASQVDAAKAKGQYAGGSFWYSEADWQSYGVSFWNFYHKELRHHAAIFYSDYLPPGNYHLSYVAQAIAPGVFNVMPTHAEEMYEPDVYGTSLPAKLKVIRDKR